MELRSHGASNDLDGLIALCHAHHQARHDGLLLVEGTASKGFRFAHRQSVSDDWEYWTTTEAEPVVCDPHERAWDLDGVKSFEEAPAIRHEIWLSSPSRRKRTYDSDGRHRYGWFVRSPGVRYGTTLGKKKVLSDRAISALFSPLRS